MKKMIKVYIFLFALTFGLWSVSDMALATRDAGTPSSKVSQNLSLPVIQQGGCYDPDPLDADNVCPHEDQSDIHQSPGTAGVTVPQPDGNGFSFSGLCSLVGPKANNICLEVVDCMENSGKCAITECLQKPSLEECKQLCTSDPTNTACAAFECAKDPGEACCQLVKIPECCDFFDIIDTFNQCRKNPGPDCCALIGSFGGDVTFQQRCVNIINCVDKADATCCELFPDSSQECRNILGCVGLVSNGPATQMDYCCRIFPDEIVCDIYDCYKRIAAGNGRGCCEFIDDNVSGSPCETFWACKTTLQTQSLVSPAARTCCQAFVDLQSCQAMECIAMLGQDADNGVLISGGGSLEYCCSLTPESETCQKFVACFKEPLAECCNLFSSKVPACAYQTCFLSFNADFSSTAPFPDVACCQVLPSVPKCEEILKCLQAPNSSCCSLLGSEVGPVCAALTGCITTITTPSATFASKAACCQLFPQEDGNIPFRDYCTAFFLCETTPSIACCAFGQQHHDSDTCTKFTECLANPTVQCCTLYENAASTPQCEIILNCVKDPNYACCILPQLSGVPICANLLKCLASPGIACCKVFPKITTQCEDTIECYQDLVESKNSNNACCSAILGAGVDFPQCAALVACVTSLSGGTATKECCELLPGDTAWKTICDALFASVTPIDWNTCYNPDIFGGCNCPPDSPGGRNSHETIFGGS